MKYEFILKIRDHEHDPWRIKWRCVVSKDYYDLRLSKYEEWKHDHKDLDSIILINKLTDNGEFVEVIQ